jgi:hypothetical protein
MWPKWLQRRRAEPESEAPEPAPVVRAEWRELPPVPRVVPEHPLINPVQRFSDSLTSWQNPSFLEPLGHRIGPAEPSGVADLALPAAPGIDMPLARPPREVTGSRRSAVQRAVAAEPYVSPVADDESPPVPLSAVDGPGPTVAPPVERAVLELPVVTTPDRPAEPAAEQADVDTVPTIAAPEPPDPPARAEDPPAPPLPQPQLSIPRRLGLGEPIIPPTVHSRSQGAPPAPVQRSVSTGGDGPRPGPGFRPVPVRGTEAGVGPAPPSGMSAGSDFVATDTGDVTPTLGAEPEPDVAAGSGTEPASPPPALDGAPSPGLLPLAAAGPAPVVQASHGEPPPAESHTEPVVAPVVQTVPDEPPAVRAELVAGSVVRTPEAQAPLDLAVRGGPAPAPVVQTVPADPLPHPETVASPVAQTLGVEPPADPALPAVIDGPVTNEPPVIPMPPVARGGPVTGPVVQTVPDDPPVDPIPLAGHGDPVVQTFGNEPAATPVAPRPAGEPAPAVRTLGAEQAGELPSPAHEPTPSAPGGDTAGPLPVVGTESRRTVQTTSTEPAVPIPLPPAVAEPHPTVQTLGVEPDPRPLPPGIGSALERGSGPHPVAGIEPVQAWRTEPGPAVPGPTALPVAGTGSRPTVQTTRAEPEPAAAPLPVTGGEPGPTVQTLGVEPDLGLRATDPPLSITDSGPPVAGPEPATPLPGPSVSGRGIGPAVASHPVVQTLGARPQQAWPVPARDPAAPPGATVQRVAGPVATPPAASGAGPTELWSAGTPLAGPVAMPGPTSPTLGAEPGLTVLALAAPAGMPVPVPGPPGTTVSRLVVAEAAAPMRPAVPSPQPLVMSAPAAVAPISVAVQRVDEAPAAEPPPPAEPAPAAAPEAAAPPVPAQAAAGGGDPEELVKKLFDPLLRRLKTELRLDRERHGRLTDLTH